ncbi:hypothetical protein EC970259_A0144 [Escherichia coli 99.0741]|nr:hypothetical protein EC970259_A0144 [Escherichia coli 99.0741]
MSWTTVQHSVQLCQHTLFFNYAQSCAEARISKYPLHLLHDALSLVRAIALLLLNQL